MATTVVLCGIGSVLRSAVWPPGGQVAVAFVVLTWWWCESFGICLVVYRGETVFLNIRPWLQISGHDRDIYASRRVFKDAPYDTRLS